LAAGENQLENDRASAAALVRTEKLVPSDDDDDADAVGDDTAMNDTAAGEAEQNHALDETLFSLPFRCSICANAYAKSSDLTQHVSEHGVLEKRRYRPTGGGPPYVCQVCSSTSSTHSHFPRLPGWVGTRKVKPIWILLMQETVSGSGISWAVCKSAPRSRQITTPAPHHSVFSQAGCPSCRPTDSVKALKATQ